MIKSIGWKEYVDLKALNLFSIPAKVDTGAKTSVLHCSRIELITHKRRKFIKFLPLDEHSDKYGNMFTFPCHKERKVKSSFGNEENRFIIKTQINLFNEQYEIELSLRDRSNMEYPMLLGRSFLKNQFMVDVSRANLSRKYLQYHRLYP